MKGDLGASPGVLAYEGGMRGQGEAVRMASSMMSARFSAGSRGSVVSRSGGCVKTSLFELCGWWAMSLNDRLPDRQSKQC